jgi:hypothetical protein
VYVADNDLANGSLFRMLCRAVSSPTSRRRVARQVWLTP